MNDIISLIMTYFSVFSIVITGIILWNTLYKTRELKKASKQLELEKKQDLSEYEEILKATCSLESEREKNKGEHFDELVYLERANLIRKKSPFFSWVK